MHSTDIQIYSVVLFSHLRFTFLQSRKPQNCSWKVPQSFMRFPSPMVRIKCSLILLHNPISQMIHISSQLTVDLLKQLGGFGNNSEWYNNVRGSKAKCSIQFSFLKTSQVIIFLLQVFFFFVHNHFCCELQYKLPIKQLLNPNLLQERSTLQHLRKNEQC